MTGTVERQGSGFVVRDGAGNIKASIVLGTGPEPGEGALLVRVGNASFTIPLDVDGFKHGEAVFFRSYREALFARSAARDAAPTEGDGLPAVISAHA